MAKVKGTFWFKVDFDGSMGGEENKNRGLEIANIINGKMNTVITEIRKSGR